VLLASGVLASLAVLQSRRASEPSAVGPPLPSWLREPLMLGPREASAAPGDAGAIPVAAAPTDGAVFDPSTVTQVLDEPDLHEVRALVSRESYQAAADRLEALLERSERANDATVAPAVAPGASAAVAPGSSATPRASSSPTTTSALVGARRFQLALLRVRSGNPGAAVIAFDRSAAVDWPLAADANLRAARLLFELGQPAEALVRAERGARIATLADEAALLRARSLAALRRVDEAAPSWKAYLGREPRPADWQTEALRWARALLEEPSVAHAESAAEVAGLVIYQSPYGRGVGEARELERRAIATLPFDAQKRFVEPARDEEVVRARQLADANQGREALAIADRVLAALQKQGGDGGAVGCEAHSARGKALASLKRYSESSEAFGAAIERCSGGALATALFLGARSSLRGGRPALARQRYAELEARFRDHRLADDARVHGAEAARDLGDHAAFTAMLLSLASDYPDGDMVDQGLFALALARIKDGDWASAVLPLERAQKRQRRGRPYWAEGRPQYFLGRAYLELGRADEGKALLATVIREFPLSYFMLLAYSRLRALEPSLADRALAEAEAREPRGRFVIPDHPELHRPEFLRAVELVRQGESAAALRELEALGVREKTAHPSIAWAGAALLARIEAAAESHGILRGLDTWTEHFPSGVWRPVWELAYPRPYRQVVPAVTARFGIPEHLAYAIMREESAFRPTVSSPAAAHGLMQLIVPTAKTMAKGLGVGYDERALKTPAVNITLGSRFLSVLTRRFAYDPLLAIPGYNAGPGAPERWVAAQPSADFDVFVESIPYTETREYMKRVMKTMAAYATLYGDGLASTLVLPPIKVKPDAEAAVPSPGPRVDEPVPSDDAYP